jgi:NAD(P)-dependent dehydrogenase (short-subunit alcohol dehydrogenase family)
VVADLDGRIAVVTGGLSGIGRASADALARDGAQVVVADIGGRVEGCAHKVVRTDVTDEHAVAELVSATEDRHGRIDIVVCAAGVQTYGTAAETTPALLRRTLEVDLVGAFLTVSAALPSLRRSGRGSIVLISSVQGLATQPNVAAYTTAKGGLNALTRSLAVDEGPHGVRANAVLPGSVDTPMLRASAAGFSDGSPAAIDAILHEWGRSHPMGRIARAAEVGEVVAFLAGDRASFISGACIPVDGGLLAALGVGLPS